MLHTIRVGVHDLRDGYVLQNRYLTCSYLPPWTENPVLPGDGIICAAEPKSGKGAVSAQYRAAVCALGTQHILIHVSSCIPSMEAIHPAVLKCQPGQPAGSPGQNHGSQAQIATPGAAEGLKLEPQHAPSMV